MRDTIDMAREAGIYHAFDSEGHWDGLTDVKLINRNSHPDDIVYGDKRIVEILKVFEALIRADERSGAEERFNALLDDYCTALETIGDMRSEDEVNGIIIQRHEATIKRLEAKILAEREAIIGLLKGIDETETESAEGWWETSAGAEFGAGILAAIRARGGT